MATTSSITGTGPNTNATPGETVLCSSATSTAANKALEQKQAYFTLAVTVLLNTWPALSLAVQNSWGGPDSSDKRDWFAGAVVDLFVERPDTDQEDVEDVLLQVMADEFEVQVEDGTEVELARRVMQWKKECEKGDFTGVREMYAQWKERRGKGVVLPKGVEVVEEDGEDDSEDDEEDDDVNMEDAEALVPDLVPAIQESKKKPEPEIDEDGFTKVTGRKKR